MDNILNLHKQAIQLGYSGNLAIELIASWHMVQKINQLIETGEFKATDEQKYIISELNKVCPDFKAFIRYCAKQDIQQLLGQ